MPSIFTLTETLFATIYPMCHGTSAVDMAGRVAVPISVRFVERGSMPDFFAVKRGA